MDENNNIPAAPKNNMMPLALGALALLLIGGGAFFFISNNKNAAMTADDTNTINQSENSTVNETVTEPTTVMGGEGDVEGSVKTFEVSGAASFDFDPAEIRVKQGDTVRIVFTSTGGMHDFVIDEFDAKTKILQAEQSETIEFVASEVGTFEYYCSVGNHRQMGMVGNLVVEE